jgi:hypothetical protein
VCLICCEDVYFMVCVYLVLSACCLFFIIMFLMFDRCMLDLIGFDNWVLRTLVISGA